MAITKIIKPFVELKYNNKNCTQDFSPYLRQISYQDYESEQSDELNITLNNNDGYFSDLWYPEKGDKISCTMYIGSNVFNCGTFTIDDNNFNFGVRDETVEVRALATSINKPVRTPKYKNYSGKSIYQIISSIAKNYNLKVLADDDGVKIGTLIQKNESDINFLKRIAKEYGYIFNIKDGYLSFISLDSLNSSESLFSLSKSDLESLMLNDTVTKIYGQCTVTYLDTKTKTLKTYTAQGSSKSTDELPVHKRFSSLQEAKIYADSIIKANHHEINGSIKPSVYTNEFLAGVNFDIFGIGKFEGKYHIKSTRRTISSGSFALEGEIEKCM